MNEQDIDLPQRQRKPDIHYHSQADNFGRRLEISERIFHPGTVRNAACTLKPISPDTALEGRDHRRMHSMHMKLTGKTFAEDIRARANEICRQVSKRLVKQGGPNFLRITLTLLYF